MKSNLTRRKDKHPEWTAAFRREIGRILYRNPDRVFQEGTTEDSLAIRAAIQLWDFVHKDVDFLNDPDWAQLSDQHDNPYTPDNVDHVDWWCNFVKETNKGFLRAGTLNERHFVYKKERKKKFQKWIQDGPQKVIQADKAHKDWHEAPKEKPSKETAQESSEAAPEEISEEERLEKLEEESREKRLDELHKKLEKEAREERRRRGLNCAPESDYDEE